MRWTIFAFGKLKEAYWQQSLAEYLKRLGPYRPVDIQELPDERVEIGNENRAVTREGERVLGALKEGSYLIALTERGDQLDSEAFSARLARQDHEGHAEVAFVIGGANGLSNAVLQRANWQLGLSRLTLPHQLARVVLVEQLYRAERIRRGEPYHK